VKTFGEFVLEFDWMLKADGNSGVKYLVQKVDEWVNKDGRQARARGLESRHSAVSGTISSDRIHVSPLAASACAYADCVTRFDAISSATTPRCTNSCPN
jgi:hypothetical protein